MGGLFAIFVQYLKKKFNTTKQGTGTIPTPLFLTHCKSERGGKKGWMAPWEDHDSRANVDCGLCWNVNIKLIVAFAAWQICVVKAPVHASGAQATFGSGAGAFPSQIMESGN